MRLGLIYTGDYESECMNNIDNKDAPMIPMDLDKKINHYVQSFNINVHHFYIHGVIEDEISMYSDLLNVLKTSNENDTIIMYINSEGGSLRIALQIANAMLATPAKVITSLDGEACSAATLLFLAGHEFIVNPNCTFMIHFYSSGVWGKGHELESRVNHLGSNVAKLMRSFYDKILSEEEMNGVISGRDIYMDSDELLERLESCQEKLEIEEQEILANADSSKFSEATTPTPSKNKSKKKKKKKTTKKKAVKHENAKIL